jgi:type I restriction enzyme M protein
MDAAEYKHVVLGLIFLKYISDAFEVQHAKLEAERAQGADPEDPDEYRAEGIFWVPPEARWSELQRNGRQPTIGQLVDDAMAAVERDNPSLRGVLPKDYARPALTAGRYVGAEAVDDGGPFEQKIVRLVAQLRDQQAEARGSTPPSPLP